MKLIKSFYYMAIKWDLDNPGQYNARQLGTLMALVTFAMWIFTLVFLSFAFDIGDAARGLLYDIFGYSSGKTISRVIGYGTMVIIYPFLYFTYGSKKGFAKLETTYMEMSKEDKTANSDFGLATLMVSILIFIVAGILAAIFS